jgi:hypothetical protein
VLPRRSTLALLGCVAWGALGAAAQNAPLGVSFHHVHVNDASPAHLIAYYEKLFDSATTKRTAIGDVRGIEAEGVFLLIDPVREEPSESATAGWHFGWGTLALDEAYDRHRMQEIDLKLPMRSFAHQLHLHLESEDPLAAAAWYRDRLGADTTTSRVNADIRPANAYHRRPAAIVRLPGISFAIYRATGPLASSRGRRIDHVAFKADLGEARARGFAVLQPSGRLWSFETMMIEGPDRLALELIGDPAQSKN